MPFSTEKQPVAHVQHFVIMWQRSLNRKRFRLLTTLCILALIALVIFVNVQGSFMFLITARNDVTSFLVQHHLLPDNRPPGPLVLKPSVVVLPQKDGFGCVVDTSWSPDSKYVVVLGYQQDCAVGGNTVPGVLTIHDATSGKRKHSFLLNDYILPVFHSQYPKLQTQGAFYYHSVLWSHDTHHLAIPFSTVFYHEPKTPSYDGVLLLDPNGGPINVFLHLNQTGYLSYLVWDIQSGSEYIAPATFDITAQNPGYTIQAASYYSWGFGGGAYELLPGKFNEGFFPKSTPNATGNPNGGKAFTIWQPGILSITTGNGNESYPSRVASWSTYFVAWSPDGRYIVDNLLMDGRFNIPGSSIPDHKTLVNLNMDLLPLLSIRDKALVRILQNLASTPAPVGVGYIGTSISWRFDGTALAAYSAGDIYDTNVDIYRCTDGTHVATLHPSTPSTVQIGGETALRWSDDGSHVLLFDPGVGTVMIWKLPSSF